MSTNPAYPSIVACLMLSASIAMGSAANEAPAEPPVAITVWAPTNPDLSVGDPHETPIQTFLEQETGLQINWIHGSQDSQFAKLALRIASGDAPDMLSRLPPEYFEVLAAQRVLLPLDDLISSYDVFTQVPPNLWEKARLQGSLYAVPQEVPANGAPLMHMDWLKANGFKTPVNLDDYISIMEAFKTENPLSTPMTGVPASVWGNASPFCSYFGTCDTYVERDDKVVDTRVQPETKDFLTLLQQLVAEGLLDRNYPNNDSQIVGDKVAAGSVAFWSPTLWEVSSLDPDVSESFGFVAPAQRPDQTHLPACQSKQGFNAITVNSRHPTETMRLLAEYYGVLTAYHGKWGTDRASTVDCSLHQDILTYAPSIPEYDATKQRLIVLTAEAFDNMILGTEPIDEAFDAYIKEWQRLGGKAAEEAVNNWWSSQ